MSETSISAVRSRHEDELLALPNVRGVAIGERRGRPVIQVLVTEKVPESTLEPDERVPASLEGYEVDVEEIGVVEAERREET
jgi:hypothetical protein